MPRKYREVLSYLKEMMEYTRLAHRHDLEGEYHEAWEVAARTVYGKLPPRPEPKSTYTPVSTSSPADRPTPPWRTQMLEKPLRKVVAVLDDYLVLECGHRVWSPLQGDLPERKQKRRRCADCARAKAAEAAKKPPTAEPSTKSRKAEA